eukprot:scaffold28707_cov83-Isochrysis_galbana.AAC.2
MQRFYNATGITHVAADAHMHTAVGCCERFNASLRSMARAAYFDSAFLPVGRVASPQPPSPPAPPFPPPYPPLSDAQLHPPGEEECRGIVVVSEATRPDGASLTGLAVHLILPPGATVAKAWHATVAGRSGNGVSFFTEQRTGALEKGNTWASRGATTSPKENWRHRILFDRAKAGRLRKGKRGLPGAAIPKRKPETNSPF